MVATTTTECLRLTRTDSGRASLVLSGDFDTAAAEHLDDLVRWLIGLGTVHLTAEVLDEPDSPDGFALRRLVALARARRLIEASGGSITVLAASRLRRTLEAMRLPTPDLMELVSA
ncbi:MAG TPA: hypothetical protein VNA12_01620 [Mycobacteriales bacterium]|nr:hypothetical protein [Mycobacteriales bacterium]